MDETTSIGKPVRINGVLMCEAYFESLAASDPPALHALLEHPEMPPHLLTYAAEIAGQDCPAAVPVLLRLLKYPAAVVREGVLAGLFDHAQNPEVVAALEAMYPGESSDAVSASINVLLSRAQEIQRQILPPCCR